MILMYHNVVPDSAPSGYKHTSLTLPVSVFERHLRWLARNFNVLSLADYLQIPSRERVREKNIALTFDDGTAITFETVYPLLEKYAVPATIFVTVCHLENGSLMWGSYLNALCYEHMYDSVTVRDRVLDLTTAENRIDSRHQLQIIADQIGDHASFAEDLSSTYPITEDVVPYYRGMSYQQLRQATDSDYVEIASHSVTHPYLSKIPRDQQAVEIRNSKVKLEELTGERIRYFAYPSGDYNETTLALVEDNQYDAAFATISKSIRDKSRFEIERMGVYSSSINKLRLKLGFFGRVARQMGVRIG